jgi:hypothetical protein
MRAQGILIPEVRIVATYGGVVSGNLQRPESLLEVFLIFDDILEPSPAKAVHVAEHAASCGFKISSLEDEIEIVEDVVIPVLDRDSLGAMLLLPEKTPVLVTLGPVFQCGLSLYICGQAKVWGIKPSRAALHILPVTGQA